MFNYYDICFSRRFGMAAILLMLAFGLSAQNASIGDKAFIDINADGIHNDGEPGLRGVYVLLFDAADQQVGFAVTDIGGLYSFANVTPGQYKVKFANLAAFLPSPMDQGSNDANDSDADPNTGMTNSFTVNAGDNITNLDAGFMPNANFCSVTLGYEISNLQCSDNGTPNNTADDHFSFTFTAKVLANPNNVGLWGWSTYIGGQLIHGMYDLPIVLGPFPVSGGAVNFTYVDDDNNTCTAAVSVTANCPPPGPCDIETSGCMTFSLLSITTASNGQKTYTIKITNNCDKGLSNVAFQLPSGVVAVAPVNNYTSPNGRNYNVENPTNNPFYSIKFETLGEGIKNGQMDIFSYTLPAGAPVLTEIKVQSKAGTPTYTVYLNTTGCNGGNLERVFDLVELDGDETPAETDDYTVTTEETEAETQTEVIRDSKADLDQARITLQPNPARDQVWLNLTPIAGQAANIQVLNQLGQTVQVLRLDEAGESLFPLDLSALNNGCYFVVVESAGERQVVRLIVRK